MKSYYAMAITLGLWVGCGDGVRGRNPILTPEGTPAVTDPDPRNPANPDSNPDPIGRTPTPIPTGPNEPWDDTPPDETSPEETPDEVDVTDPAIPLPVVPGTASVIVSGGFVATVRPSDQCLTIANLASGSVIAHTALCAPRGLAAVADGFLVLSADGRHLHHLALPGLTATLIATTDFAYTGLVVAKDGGHAVLATVPVRPADLATWALNPTDLALCRLAVVDLESFAVEAFLTANAIRDVDITSNRIVVTMGYHDKFGLPHAVLQVFDRDGLAYLGAVDFPNCADDLQIHPDEQIAVLAPRSCGLQDVIIAQPEIVDTWSDFPDPPPGEGDPISFVDIQKVEHLANVPGFGPAVFSPDGAQVGGFTLRDTLAIEWNLFQHDAFGVVVANTADYTFKVADAGDVRPHFVFGSDGAFYVEGSKDGAPYTAFLDEETHELVTLEGDAVSLSARAQGADGALYVVSEGALVRVSREGLERLVLDVHGDVVSASGDGLVLTDKVAGIHAVITLNPLKIDVVIPFMKK